MPDIAAGEGDLELAAVRQARPGDRDAAAVGADRRQVVERRRYAGGERRRAGVVCDVARRLAAKAQRKGAAFDRVDVANRDELNLVQRRAALRLLLDRDEAQ